MNNADLTNNVNSNVRAFSQVFQSAERMAHANSTGRKYLTIHNNQAIVTTNKNEEASLGNIIQFAEGLFKNANLMKEQKEKIAESIYYTYIISGGTGERKIEENERVLANDFFEKYGHKDEDDSCAIS